jgi:1,4-dihydroxy-2-naphthoate octaprenyltransferase
VLPALVGTTLPFWLRPPGFSFSWVGAIEFLVATVLLHAGFSLLLARVDGRSTVDWTGARLLGAGSICIAAACLLGLHLNSGLQLNRSVHESIFIVYGVSAVFVGLLYVAPPLSFFRRMGSEVVVSKALGMIPVLGAYLVQAGDLTRRVYLASIPLIVAAALWVLTDELVTRKDDEKQERRTMVILFGSRFSGRFGVLALTVLLGVTLLGTVITASLSPWAMAAVLSFGLVWRIVGVSWKEYASPTRMLAARKGAFKLHLATCIIIAAASLMGSPG